MSSSKHLLTVPHKPHLHEAFGRLAIAYAHLELILRYTVKTLAELPRDEGLDATRGWRMSDVMERVKKLFKEKHVSVQEQTELDALLGKAKLLSRKRNAYSHSAWSETQAGETVLKSEADQWEPAPLAEDVEQVASEIVKLGDKINDARLRGVVHKVLERHKLTSSPPSSVNITDQPGLQHDKLWYSVSLS